MSETDFSGFYEVNFHPSPEAQTVFDGESKLEDRDFFEFPAVSVCIPIIITNSDESIILGAIHANGLWTPARLNELLAILISQGASKIFYAERIESDSNKDEFVSVKNKSRQAILKWLESKPLGLTVTRTPIPTSSFIDHIGYKKKSGFKKLKVIFSKK